MKPYQKKEIKQKTRLLVHLTSGTWWFLTEEEIKDKLEIDDTRFKWHYMTNTPINSHIIVDIDRKELDRFCKGEIEIV